MSPLVNIAIKFLGGAAVLGLVVFVSFKWGYNDCQKDAEEAARKIADEHATTVNHADRAATSRSLDAQEKDLTNEQIIENLRRELAEAEGGGDECFGVDYLDQLRELQ